MRVVMKKEFHYLMQNGFAAPSSSPWGSPCLLNTKSDGNTWFCTDFHNTVTVPDVHTLPLIDDCIYETSPAIYISQLDTLKGYWQVPLMHPHASDISAFVTPDTLAVYSHALWYCVYNAPSTLSKVSQHSTVIGDVQNCEAYLDDIVVYSVGWASFIAIVRKTHP